MIPVGIRGKPVLSASGPVGRRLATIPMMMYRDRRHAGELLARQLLAYRGQKPLVLALPPGGVLVGRQIADELGGDLDLLLVHRLAIPGNPNCVIGSITENGHVELGPFAVESPGTRDLLKAEIHTQIHLLKVRRDFYTPVGTPADPKDRITIIADDGCTPGSDFLAALKAVRERGPRRLIVAVPILPKERLVCLCAIADEVICPATPAFFGTVRRFFEDFPPVTEDQVVEALRADPTRTLGKVEEH